MKNNSTQKLVYTSVLVALCVILPYVFHFIPNGGIMFSPMHFPVILCAMICGWQYGLICSIFGPVLSFLLTSMPDASNLPSMIVELSIYSISSSLLLKIIRTKHMTIDILISLIISMIVGRIFGGVIKAIMFTSSNYSFEIWLTSYFVKGFPGIIIQIILIPTIMMTLMKRRIIDERYSDYKDEYHYERIEDSE